MALFNNGLLRVDYDLGIGDQQFQLDCSRWPAGVYFVQAVFGEEDKQTRRLVLE